MSGEGGFRLGMLAPDRARSLVAVSADGELGVALRDALPRELVVVRDARPGDCTAAVAASRPWPWMLCGSVDQLPPAVSDVLRRAPVLVVWLGELPQHAPPHAVRVSQFSMLVRTVRSALDAQLEGMRLGPGLGVVMPDGACVRSAALEALISLHPAGFNLPLQRFRTASSSLRRHGVQLMAARDASRRVALVPVQA